MNRRVLLLIVIVAAIVAAIWALSRVPAGPAGTADIPVPSGAAPKSGLNGPYPRAKEIVNPSGFVNTDPFRIASLLGSHVVLVDFWTYSCINCLRTLPYLNDWYAKYHDMGLVIVGVHSPEFDFEKDINNVRAAVTRLGVQYPVVLDNDMGTWSAYGNQYWPHEYLIDADGFIVHDHIGEGGYDETEKEIQSALADLMQKTGQQGTADAPIRTPVGVATIDFSKIRTPELYVGSGRNDGVLANGKTGTDGQQTLTLPSDISTTANVVYLGGSWLFASEYARTTSATAHIRLRYSAKQVNIVAGSDAGVHLTVRRDGQLLTPGVAGADAAGGSATIRGQRLYELINDSAGYGGHTIDIEVDGSGLDLFTFTFG